MTNIGLDIWRARKGDDIGSLSGPLSVVFIIDVEWLRFVFFAGYDFVAIDFLKYAEDSPPPGVVVDRSEGGISPYFALLRALMVGTAVLLVDVVRIAVLLDRDED